MRKIPTSEMDHAEWRNHYSGGQSKAFMADLWPTISRWLMARRNIRVSQRKKWRILDVGCGTGHGTALLGSMLRHGIDESEVTGLDLEKGYIHEARLEFPWCKWVCLPQGIYSLSHLTFDLVISSHVLEHVCHPISFIEKCQSLSTDGVILYAPYEEDPSNLVPGHLHSFGPADIYNFGASMTEDNCQIIHPLKWGTSAFILELPGKASK
jgi:2-polyprenyl-3-methyl-5-hydroxy-6-metoxy-1,4-benzoquinol methylase